MDRIDIMTDIETLGTKEDVTIIQLSAIAFNIETGGTIDTYNRYFDITKKDNITIDGSTLKWWLNTNKELLAEIINTQGVEDFFGLQLFHNWIKNLPCDDKKKYLWGNGILFDNRIIQEAMRNHFIEYPIFYRNDRDVRTIVELASIKEGISEEELKARFNDSALVQHNAFDDVKFQINLVCGCYNIIMKK